jgi:hypothetical protein
MALQLYQVYPGEKGAVFQTGESLVIAIGTEFEIERLKSTFGRYEVVKKFECEDNNVSVM